MGADTEILAATRAGITAIRVRGRGTFKVSRQLAQFGERVLSEGAKGVILDLGECTGLDSTFLGVLAMLGLQGRGCSAFAIVNASPALRELLTTIGVSRLWRFSAVPAPERTWATICRAAAEAFAVDGAAETVLQAHQTLMELDPENVPRFETLVKMLVDELSQQEEQRRQRAPNQEEREQA
ncbi:MAG: STAS domain-containing protein [Lentisphaeria bacterium]|nr:STAS domain-containing protein [Lentisphaeria bacterium]